MPFNIKAFGATTTAKPRGFNASAFKGVSAPAAKPKMDAPKAPVAPTTKRDAFTGRDVPWDDRFGAGSGLAFDVIGKGGVNYPAFESGYSASFKVDKYSGQPLLQRARPDRRSSEILPERVAQTFDITKPQKLDRFTTKRMPLEASQEVRKIMGASYDEQLDHEISLQLGGSNQPSNLKPVKLVDGKQPLVGLENGLARRVIDGEISLLEAQRQLAWSKGKPIPDMQDLPSVQEARRDEVPKITEMFPGAIAALAELQMDPLSFHADPSKAMEAYLMGMADQADAAAQEWIKLFNPKTTISGRIGAFLGGSAKTVGAAISPITALFGAAEEIPVIGTVAKLIGVPFAVAGDLGHGAANLAGETMLRGVPEEERRKIVDGMGEVFALAAQIALGAKAEGVSAKRAEIRKSAEYQKLIEESGLKNGDALVAKYGLDDPVTLAALEKKYGPQDTATIVKKAYEMAGQDVPLLRAPADRPLLAKPKEAPREPITVPQVKRERVTRNSQLKDGDIVYMEEVGRFVVSGKKTRVTPKGKETNYTLKDTQGNVYEQSAADLAGFTLERKTGEKPIKIAQTPKPAKAPASEAPVVAPESFKVPREVPEAVPVPRRAGQPLPESTGTPAKPSKVARSIEAKAIEAGLTKGFSEVSGYTPLTIKEQSTKAADLINRDFDTARAVVRGEKPLPDDLRGTSLITAMEEYLKRYPDRDLAYELANSPLVSETSFAAQEMRLARERTPDSATLRLQQIRDARAKKAEKKAGTRVREQTKKTLKDVLEKNNLTKEELSWDKFLEQIKC